VLMAAGPLLGARSEERHALPWRAEGEDAAVGRLEPVTIVGVVIEPADLGTIECNGSSRPVERGIEREHPSVRGHEPVTTAVGDWRDGDYGLIES
jgi:hypothetical protein